MRRSTIALALAIAAAAPATASASSVSVVSATAVFQSGATASDLTVSTHLTDVRFADALQSISVGTGCVAGPPVACSPSGWATEVQFGAGNDALHAFSNGPLKVSGDDGDDALHASGDNNHVTAGNGDDDVWANANSATNQVDGGPGADRLYGFEGFAQLAGGTGDDVLYGDVTFTASLAGDDDADELVGGRPSGLHRGSGDEDGGAGDDAIVSVSPGWTVEGGAGDDTVQSAAGGDTIDLGDGDDTLDAAHGGSADTITCGSGTDTVYADAGDSVAGDCESVTIGSAPSLPAITAALSDAAAIKALS
jgi:Ca2+-binding RTX toxin-like protein